MGGCLSWCYDVMSGTSGGLGDSAPRSVVINKKHYTILSVLGEGGYATVYRARDDEKEVALKRVRFPSERRTSVEQEIKFLKMAKTCPFIIDLYDAEIRGGNSTVVDIRGDDDEDDENSSTSSPAARRKQGGNKNNASAISSGSSSSCDGEAWMVLELCGDSAFVMLQNRINQVRLMQRGASAAEGCLPIEQILCILDSIVHAIAFLHRMNPPIASWDVKLQNLVKAAPNSVASGLPPGSYKLCDFGSATQHRIAPCANARQVNAASIILDERLTLAYRSPESLDLFARHSVDTKVDVWAIGVMLYTMMCARLPFEENARQIMDNAMIPFPEQFSKEDHPFKPLVKIVTEGLLVADPMKRWNIFQLSKKLHSLYPNQISQVEEEPPNPLVMNDFRLPGMSN